MKNHSRSVAFIGIGLITILGLASCTWNEPESSAEYQVNDLGPAPIITSPYNDASFYALKPIEFTGTISPNVLKIGVVWNGGTLGTDMDNYVLTNFKAGDTTFSYVASTDLKNLIVGTNRYEFTAYYDLTNTFKKSTTLTIYYTPLLEDVDKDPNSGYIRVTSPPDKASFYSVDPKPIEFKGDVSMNATKIGVKWAGGINTGGDGINFDLKDDYVLTNYKAGDKTFSYTASAALKNLVEGTNKYVFTAYYEKTGMTTSTTHTIFYSPGGAEMGKPVIYLYPQKEMNVDVNVKPTNGISVSVPAIHDSWHVRAKPNGQITNLSDGKIYSYLFWEGFASRFVTPKDGFVVAQNDVSKFFEDKLNYLGLNKKEISDFQEYWVPKLKEKPYYFITFIDQPSIDAYAPLMVNPKPDSVIRVFFDHKGLDKKISVPTQTLTRGVRTGFAVTEWGGRLYP